MSDTRRSSAFGRIGTIVLDIVELYVPVAAFILLFLLFVVNVFFRYVLNAPLTWPYEVISLSFVWIAVLGATYVRRVGGHVKFTLVYDDLSPRGQRWSRIAANGAIFVAFAVAVPASLDWVLFMDFKGTPILRIPFSWGYMPIVVFLVLIAGHSLYDVVRDIRGLLGHESEDTPE